MSICMDMGMGMESLVYVQLYVCTYVMKTDCSCAGAMSYVQYAINKKAKKGGSKA